MAGLLSTIRRAVSPRTTVGTTGTAIIGGQVLTDEKNAKLVGTTRYKTYSDHLANISIVGAGTRLFANLIGKSAWRFEPAEGGGAEAERLADLIDEIVNDMQTPWHRVVRRAAMHRYYGFSVAEWTAKRRPDGVIGLLDIAPRPQRTIERWEVDDAGVVIGVYQRSPQNGQEIFLPREKLLYLVDDTLNDSPEGLGIFRHIVDTATRLDRLQQLEQAGFGTDLRGVPIGRGPFAAMNDAKMTAAAKTEAAAAITAFITKHNRNPDAPLGLLLDSKTYRGTGEQQTPSAVRQWDVELLTTNSTGLPDAAKAIERMQREIARLMGAEGLLLGDGDRGSNALSQDKTKNLGLIVDGTLREVSETVDQDITPTVFKLNGWNEDLMPTAKTEAIQFREIEQITGALRDMALAGAPLAPEDEAVGEVRDLLGLSRSDPLIDSIDASLRGNDGAEIDDVRDLNDDEDKT